MSDEREARDNIDPHASLPDDREVREPRALARPCLMKEKRKNIEALARPCLKKEKCENLDARACPYRMKEQRVRVR